MSELPAFDLKSRLRAEQDALDIKIHAAWQTPALLLDLERGENSRNIDRVCLNHISKFANWKVDHFLAYEPIVEDVHRKLLEQNLNPYIEYSGRVDFGVVVVGLEPGSCVPMSQLSAVDICNENAVIRPFETHDLGKKFEATLCIEFLQRLNTPIAVPGKKEVAVVIKGVQPGVYLSRTEMFCIGLGFKQGEFTIFVESESVPCPKLEADTYFRESRARVERWIYEV